MKHFKQEIGEKLKRELDKGYDVIRISHWAHDLFFYSQGDFAPERNEILQQIFLMEAGPEFEYPEEELRLLSQKLINNEKDPLKQIDEMKKAS